RKALWMSSLFTVESLRWRWSLEIGETGAALGRPQDDLLTGRPVRLLQLRSFLSNCGDFVAREQTLHLNVAKGIGRCRNTDHGGCHRWVGVKNPHCTRTLCNRAVHGDQLAASCLQ